ncbi:MAG: oligosaccharide flippase family protein [Anaerolineales bacterium]
MFRLLFISGPARRLAKNSLWMVISRFGAQGLAAVFTILIARRLGSAGFGAYAFIAAIIFIGNALTTFGTDMLIIREIAAQNDMSRLPASLALQLILSILIIVSAWLFGASIPNQSVETITALKIYSLSLIPLAFFTVFTIALRGKQRMDAYMLLNLTIAALQIAVVLLPKFNLITLSVFLLSIQMLAALLAGAICFQMLPGFWRIWGFHLENTWAVVKAAAPIALLVLLGMAYQKLSIILLSAMGGPVETGIYSAAARVVEASKMVHLAVFAALYPALAQGLALQDAYSSSALLHVASTYLKYLLTGAAIITFTLFAFARPLMALLYGQEFAASTNVLRIVAWTLIPFTINSYLTLTLLASRQEKKIARALMASLFGLLVLNLWWIPAHGSEGSAWATLVAESIQSIALLAQVSAHIFIKGARNEFSELF